LVEDDMLEDKGESLDIFFRQDDIDFVEDEFEWGIASYTYAEFVFIEFFSFDEFFFYSRFWRNKPFISKNLRLLN